ncbi:MAG TPA: LnmK family bifunctional acyltransferase/decarboxylase [Vicinamibacterales bacterium]|nr:LnmK family bifunctional acyltransferase/decarboxylase [Vicinamibacterales bacterium]
MNFSCRLTLGMPHTNRRGLPEVELMKQAGHAQWQAIAAAIGRPLSTLRTVSGGEVYAGFYYIETTVPAEAPLESFRVDDTISFDVSLRAFKNISLEGRVRVRHVDGEARMGGPDIRFATIFMTPVSGNNDLKVAPPAGVDCSGIPPLPNDENPFNQTRAAREDGTLNVFTDSWRDAGGQFEFLYQIDRDRDTNGAGLVYFANYIAFSDAAERALSTVEPGGASERSLRHRRTAYYGNADIDDRLLVRTTVFANPVSPAQIGYRHVVVRQRDAALICLTEVIKAAEAPLGR